MSTFANSLANVLTISALVAIFLSLRQNNRTARFKLWLVGWMLMWVHFALTLLPPISARVDALVSSVQIATLGVAGLAFLVSVTVVVDETRWRRLLIAVNTPLISMYALALGFDYTPRLALTVVAASVYLFALTVFILRYRK